MRGLLDTSVFVATEQGRPLGKLPDEGAISVMALAGLHVAVLVATEAGTRAQRLRTLAEVERTFEAIPVDDAVARTFAEVVAASRRRRAKPKVVDTLIAATAIAHRLTLYTQDADFEGIPRVRVARV